MFGPVVGLVGGFRVPVVSKLALGILAAKPMESHVNCFGAASLDVVGDDTMCCAVVCLDGCGRLLVAHLFEEVSHGDRFTGVKIQSAKFNFGCTGHDHDCLEIFGDIEDGDVVGWIIDVGQAEEVTTNMASG